LIISEVKNDIFNVAGGFEQSNIDTVKKIISSYCNSSADIDNFIDFSYSRDGQDMRYALNDSKLRKLGWSPQKKFDDEIDKIVSYYKENFIW